MFYCEGTVKAVKKTSYLDATTNQQVERLEVAIGEDGQMQNDIINLKPTLENLNTFTQGEIVKVPVEFISGISKKTNRFYKIINAIE